MVFRSKRGGGGLKERERCDGVGLCVKAWGMNLMHSLYFRNQRERGIRREREDYLGGAQGLRESGGGR